MSEEITELDVLKNNVVKDLFLKTADQTYVVARWCFLNRLYLDFYWNGLHAVEKYLKAALLLNGRAALNNSAGESYGHNISTLYREVHAFAGEFFPQTLEQPVEIEIIHWTDETTDKFVERLNGLGDPNNRYNVYGFTQRPEDLYKLDRLIFTARNVAQQLEGYAFLGTHKRSGGPDLSNADLLRRSPDRLTGMVGSRLFDLTGEKATAEVRRAALEHNLPFAPPEFNHGGLPSGWSSDTAVLYRRIIAPTEQDPSPQDVIIAELADWVVDSIYLPKSAKREIRAAANKLRNRSVA